MSFNDLLQAALAHQHAGRLDAADAAYAQLIRERGDDPTVLHAWALLAAQRKEFATALQRVDRALAAWTTDAALHNLRGRLLVDAGRIDEAIAAYERAIAIDPNLADAHNNLGSAASAAGMPERAIAAYARAAELGPEVARYHTNLAVALRAAGRLEEALARHDRAVAIDPRSAEAHNNRGNTLRRMERIAEAIEAYRRAIAISPADAAAHSNLAAALTDGGDAEAALAAADAALAIDPNLAEAHNHRGAALAAAGRFDEAAEAHRRAIALRSAYAEAHSNLALALLEIGDDDGAIASARRATELEPALGPAHVNLAHILAALGMYEQAWPENEWRFACNARYRAREFLQPQWRGEALGNRMLLIHAEQGFGDAIQFVRYVPLIAAAHPAARIVVECHRELLGLFAGVSGVAEWIAAGEVLPAFDLHCPLLSLPLAFGTTLATVPAAVPYLRAEPALVEWWAKRLGPREPGERRIGLVWAGRPTHSNDRRRSMRLADFAPLARVPGITFHSLQKGPAAAQASEAPAGLRLIDHAAELVDFPHTAALIAQLDGVVAVDTAVAHLAGALGAKTWLLLPQSPDWRWVRGRDDSPWYPTMRVFRQEGWGEWGNAVECAAEELKKRPQDFVVTEQTAHI